MEIGGDVGQLLFDLIERPLARGGEFRDLDAAIRPPLRLGGQVGEGPLGLGQGGRRLAKAALQICQRRVDRHRGRWAHRRGYAFLHGNQSRRSVLGGGLKQVAFRLPVFGDCQLGRRLLVGLQRRRPNGLIEGLRLFQSRDLTTDDVLRWQGWVDSLCGRPAGWLVLGGGTVR